MGNRNFIFKFSLIFCLIWACNKNSKNKLEIRDYYAEGTVDSNHLEKGIWKFYGLENHNLCQEGVFLNGLRVGIWKYYSPFRDSIFWIQYLNKDTLIKTNIPSFLTIDTDESGFVAFKYKDASRLLLLKVAVAQNDNFDVSSYRKIMLQEVSNNSAKVKENSYAQINTTCNRTYHFNKFSGIDKDNKHYILLTINGILNGFLIELTVRCDTNSVITGEEVFFSVLSNLFIRETRFFDSNIDCEIIRNKVIRNNQTFSFGCNRK
jgi:hypothetical protein